MLELMCCVSLNLSNTNLLCLCRRKESCSFRLIGSCETITSNHNSEGLYMSLCTAPVRGHWSARARARCPVCGVKSPCNRNRSGNLHNIVINSAWTKFSSIHLRRKRFSSSLFYTSREIQALRPVRNRIEQRQSRDSCDVFLCHSFADRKDSAKLLNDLLVSNGVSVWFSETTLKLGSSMLREIDKGLARSTVGIVLVTPGFIRSLQTEGVAEKELAYLLRTDRLIPIAHGISFEDIEKVSPLLASRTGLSTKHDSFDTIAAKIAGVVTGELGM